MTISQFKNNDFMIDWRITPDIHSPEGDGWSFPSFEIQEYLLPLINVGKDIDEYGATIFDKGDCLRLRANIDYLIQRQTFDYREEVRFDSVERGLVSLSCEEIKRCLSKLDEAAQLAIERTGKLVFYGD